ncbi:lipoprotein [Streptomyces globisporus]|uniref:lipoprotein n=1 Tax=Streptomyces globisporus TaxID=1908 RepID=UPI0004C85916|nr:lipoprotein [Streptomyces globisporus]
MPERARPTRTAVPAALVAGLLLTACGTTPKPDAPAAPTAPEKTTATKSTAPAVKAAATLGGPGTACALPVSFGLAEGWKPEAVDDPENPEFAALTRQGPAVVRCEVDAKPTGNVGYLRVWTVAKGPARAALEGFVKAADKPSAVTYRETRAGAPAATEVTYTTHGELTDETKEQRAFAVSAREGAVVIVHLGGLDTDEHRAILPAYELAKSTTKPL